MGIEKVDFGVKKITLKRGKMVTRLLLTSNRKLSTRFRLLPESRTWMTLKDIFLSSIWAQ